MKKSVLFSFLLFFCIQLLPMSKKPDEWIEVANRDIKKLYFLMLDRLIQEGLNNRPGYGTNYFEDKVFAKELFEKYQKFLKDYPNKRILKSQYVLRCDYNEPSNFFEIIWKKRKLELPIKFKSSSQKKFKLYKN